MSSEPTIKLTVNKEDFERLRNNQCIHIHLPNKELTMKPHIIKLPYQDTPWMCRVTSPTAILAGYGQSPDEAYWDLVDEIEWHMESDYTYGVEDIVQGYLEGWVRNKEVI